MNDRMQPAAHPQAPSSVALLLDELEIPDTLAFAAFADQVNARLTELEEQFSDYVTRDSFARSIGR